MFMGETMKNHIFSCNYKEDYEVINVINYLEN